VAVNQPAWVQLASRFQRLYQYNGAAELAPVPPQLTLRGMLRRDDCGGSAPRRLPAVPNMPLLIAHSRTGSE